MFFHWLIIVLYLQQMKLDSKQKYQRIRRFVAELKLKSGIESFLNTEEIVKFGIYDFFYINKNPPSFTKLEKKLKESKFDELSEFIEDIKQIFISVSDYIFQSDPLQALVQIFKQEIDRFAEKFEEDFKVTLQVQRPRPVAEIIKMEKEVKEKQPPKPARIIPEQSAPRERGLTQKLEMLFLLRANENNEAYLRSIGSVYQIGCETEQQYVITLDNKNTYWMQFLSKQEQ